MARVAQGVEAEALRQPGTLEQTLEDVISNYTINDFSTAVEAKAHNISKGFLQRTRHGNVSVPHVSMGNPFTLHGRMLLTRSYGGGNYGHYRSSGDHFS